MNNINIGVANLIISEDFKNLYFGNINESKSDSGLSVNKFFNLIEESQILKTEFKVFNNIEKKYIEEENSAIRYIDNNIKLFEIYTLDEVLNEKKKLKEFISESYKNEEFNEKIKLYESINTLIIESLKDHEDIDVDLLHESFCRVLKHIRTPKAKRIEPPKDLIDLENIDESIIKIAVNKFNEKYKSISVDDKKFLYGLIESDENKKKNLFEDYRNEAIKKLNETDEPHLIDRKHKALEKIKSMNYNKDTIDENLIKLYELKKGLE